MSSIHRTPSCPLYWMCSSDLSAFTRLSNTALFFVCFQWIETRAIRSAKQCKQQNVRTNNTIVVLAQALFHKEDILTNGYLASLNACLLLGDVQVLFPVIFIRILNAFGESGYLLHSCFSAAMLNFATFCLQNSQVQFLMSNNQWTHFSQMCGPSAYIKLQIKCVCVCWVINSTDVHLIYYIM